jgi:tryptophan-rich sensory protein
MSTTSSAATKDTRVAPWRVKATVLLALLVLSYSAAAVGNALGDLGDTSWYRKPSFQPPGWVFAVVWSTLYTLMGITAWLVWLRPHSRLRAWALLFWALQLPVNATWPGVFAGLQAPGWALAHLILLWMLVAATVVLFFRVSKPAGALLLPYLLWCTFAIALNVAVLGPGT